MNTTAVIDFLGLCNEESKKSAMTISLTEIDRRNGKYEFNCSNNNLYFPKQINDGVGTVMHFGIFHMIKL